MICAVLANIHRDKKKKPTPYEPQDFVPKRRTAKQKKAQSWQEQLLLVEIMNTAYGGQDLRGGGNGDASGTAVG